MPRTVTVRTTAELQDAIKTISQDTTILLEAGNYGRVDLEERLLQGVASNHDVTIASADPNNPAKITFLDVVGAKNLTFDGILFDYTAKAREAHSFKAFRIEDSDGVTIQNSVFDGSDARGWNNFNDGYGTGIGLFVRNSTDVELRDSELFNFNRAVAVHKSQDVRIIGNDVHRSSTDGLGFAEVRDVLIEGNYIHDFEAAANSTSHKDMIQIWTVNTSRPSEGFIIRDNVLDAGQGVATHSIAFFNETRQHIYRDVTIENNVIRNGHKHGITVEYARDVKVNNNTLIQHEDFEEADTGLYVPTINLWANVREASVRDNVVADIETTGGGHNITGNFFIQRDAPTQPGYYEDYFLNALSDSAGDWTDLMVAPGTYFQREKLGSSLLYFDTTPEPPRVLLKSVAGKELQLGEYEFDVSDVYSVDGRVDTNGATAVWDFDDGTTGRGLSVSHLFEKPGTYNVTGTITLRNGDKLTFRKTVETETSAALITDMQTNARDDSALETPFSNENGVRYVQDGGSTVALLRKNSRIEYDTGEEFYDNTGFTILAEFRKDDLGDRGKLISFLGTAVITVTDHQLSSTMLTSKGNFRLVKSYLDINDRDWHKVAVTFDGINGSGKLYLDGQLIDTVAIPKGAIQNGIEANDFYIGNNKGDSFPGLIDDVAFLRGPLSDADISALHAERTTLDAVLDGYASAPVGASPTPPPPQADPQPDPKPAPPQAETPGQGSSGDYELPNLSLNRSAYDEVINGTSRGEKLRGSTKDDYLHGGNGADTVNGAAGDDLLNGGRGRDKLYGNDGDDLLIYDSVDALLHGGRGTDTVDFKGGKFDLRDGQLYAVEVLDFTGSNNTVKLNARTVRQSDDDMLLILADRSDRFEINERGLEVQEIGSFNLNGQRYTRYELERGNWQGEIAIDADATFEVNDVVL